MTDAAKANFFHDVVDAIEQSGYGLCVLRGYREYPNYIGADIDAISDDPVGLCNALSERKVATAVQVFEHETTYYYLYRCSNGRPVFINLDLSRDYVYRGRVLLRGEEFLKTCRPFKFFKVPSAQLEFVSYFLRKVAQGSLDDRQTSRLSDLYLEDPRGATRQLARFFSEEEIALIAEAARGREWGPVRGQLKRLRRVMLGRVDRQQPLSMLRNWTGLFRRRLKRVLQPPGLMVAFLGTDGSGKSTIMARVERDLAPAFWGKKQYHKRPLSSPFRWTKRYGLRPPRSGKHKSNGGTGFNPHALPPRGHAYSLAKLAFWWADFMFLGYMLEIFPQLTRPALLLFDRYYQDLLVDSRRYHYGGPMWLARLAGRCIPQPHLLILLDAPPEVLHTRKQELPLEEITRQREAYLTLVRTLPNGHIVDTSRPLDEAAAEVEQIILDYMAGRTALKARS